MCRYGGGIIQIFLRSDYSDGKAQKLGKNVRMSFSKIDEALDLPNLIDVQKKSYEWFINEGLMEVLRDVSPITDYSGNLEIEFIDYSIDPKPKYSVAECKERDVNYAAPLRVTVRLYNKTTGTPIVKQIFMGDFPIMTENGTFIINGAERVIVSQIVRSPGMYYDSMLDKTGKRIYTAQVIPYRGAWIEYETDMNDVMYVRIDKNRKMPLTIFIRALGFDTEQEIIDLIGDDHYLRETLARMIWKARLKNILRVLPTRHLRIFTSVSVPEIRLLSKVLSFLLTICFLIRSVMT